MSASNPLSSRTLLHLACTLLLAFGLTACSDSSSTPSEPDGGTSAATNAVVQGVVNDGGGNKATMAGVTVSIQGTGLSSTTDSQGQFHLPDVPTGDQVLVFSAPAGSSAVTVRDIATGQTIDLTVSYRNGNAEVQSEERTDADEGEDDGEGDGEEDGEGEGEGEGEDDGEGETDPVDLSLSIDPSTWNLNYDNSAGTVAAFIRGQGFDQVDLDTVVLSGDDPDAAPLDPVNVSTQGNHTRARFPKAEVLDLLADPEPGSTHEVIVAFELVDGDEVLELTATVTIVGDEEDDEGEEEEEEPGNFSLQVSPSSWNTNWANSNGNLTVFIRGDGLAAIDTDSITLEGDDASAAPLPASFARLEGSHVRAQFGQSDALALLDEPERGTTHTIVVRFTADGQEFELTSDIRIVGPKQ